MAVRLEQRNLFRDDRILATTMLVGVMNDENAMCRSGTQGHDQRDRKVTSSCGATSTFRYPDLSALIVVSAEYPSLLLRKI